MYRIRHLLLLLTVLFAGYNVQAQTQSPYKYDFNSPIDTSDPEFAPLGWGHIVDAMVVRSNTYYVQYAYQATGGRTVSPRPRRSTTSWCFLLSEVRSPSM